LFRIETAPRDEVRRREHRGGALWAGQMSTDIDHYDPIFNISEADQAVAKFLTPWTPSGRAGSLPIAAQGNGGAARRCACGAVAVHACVLVGSTCVPAKSATTHRAALLCCHGARACRCAFAGAGAGAGAGACIVEHGGPRG